MGSQNRVVRALRAAFPHTIPILTGFLFLGMAYGLQATSLGLRPWQPILTATTVFAGSAEFVVTDLLRGAFQPLQTFLLIFIINARHLFYGVSLLETYKGTGWKKPYLVFGMCDESFSINCSVGIPADIDRGWFMFFVTLLDQLYWVTGVTVGALFGAVVPFSTEGIGFVMTAMFVVIFLERWLAEKDHRSALIGLGVSLGCLLLLGPDGFILPAMLGILVLLLGFRGKLKKGGEPV